MRAATTLIIALLMIVGLSGCRTAKKAVTKEETSQELAASFQKAEATTTETATSFDQAIIDQIRNRLNIIIDFKRWEYQPGEEGTPTEPAENREGIFTDVPALADKPPNARPKSYTEGTITISADGQRETTTQTTASAQQETTNQVTTAGQVENKEEATIDSKTEEKPKTGLGFFDTIFIILFGAAVIGAGIFAIKIGRSLKK